VGLLKKGLAKVAVVGVGEAPQVRELAVNLGGLAWTSRNAGRDLTVREGCNAPVVLPRTRQKRFDASFAGCFSIGEPPYEYEGMIR